MNTFDAKLSRFKSWLGASTDAEAFQVLGLTQDDLVVRRVKGVFPDVALEALCTKTGCNALKGWVLYGKRYAGLDECDRPVIAAAPSSAPADDPSFPDAPVLNALITRCRHGQALIVLQGRPFNGLEIRPHQLDRLAQNLFSVAALAKSHKGKLDQKVSLA